jgi:flagellar basal-body rod modification protein FlgD
MNINSIMGKSSAESAASTSSSSSTSSSEGADERDMFMTLLVAQLKNQDPLSPQDGAQFVAQLAQFNSLDQLVGIRDSIDQLNTALQQQQTSTPSSSSQDTSAAAAASVIN